MTKKSPWCSEHFSNLRTVAESYTGCIAWLQDTFTTQSPVQCDINGSLSVFEDMSANADCIVRLLNAFTTQSPIRCDIHGSHAAFADELQPSLCRNCLFPQALPHTRRMEYVRCDIHCSFAVFANDMQLSACERQQCPQALMYKGGDTHDVTFIIPLLGS